MMVFLTMRIMTMFINLCFVSNAFQEWNKYTIAIVGTAPNIFPLYFRYDKIMQRE